MKKRLGAFLLVIVLVLQTGNIVYAAELSDIHGGKEQSIVNNTYIYQDTLPIYYRKVINMYGETSTYKYKYKTFQFINSYTTSIREVPSVLNSDDTYIGGFDSKGVYDVYITYNFY